MPEKFDRIYNKAKRTKGGLTKAPVRTVIVKGKKGQKGAKYMRVIRDPETKKTVRGEIKTSKGK